MSWKHVFDGHKGLVGTDISEAVELALKAGYKFISHNGIVYFISQHDEGCNEWNETGIKTEELT